jgi:hypothetical protein
VRLAAVHCFHGRVFRAWSSAQPYLITNRSETLRSYRGVESQANLLFSPSMALLEIFRVILFVIEWVWTVSIMSVFPSQLMKKTTDSPIDKKVCLFDRQVDLSRCRFGTAWAAIAFAILTLAIIWYLLEFCTSVELPYNVEVIIFSWLAIWWVGFSTVFASFPVPLCASSYPHFLTPRIESRPFCNMSCFHVNSNLHFFGM